MPGPRSIGRAATLALYDELALSPKPGLVTLTSTGAHDDMDARTFLRSLLALRGYFVRIAALGAVHAPFAELERCGIEAEARMMAATGGINTHRGAIFQLGLLCAAAGSLGGTTTSQAQPLPLTPERVRDALLHHWGDALAERAKRPSTLKGGMAARALGLRSASAEAALGFPVVFDTAVPAMRDALQRGLSPTRARLDTLFHIMAVLDDSNLAHRGGRDGLAFAQQSASQFLARGGAAAADGLVAAAAIDREFIARRLSPGGAADMLSSVCWMQRLGLIGGMKPCPPFLYV